MVQRPRAHALLLLALLVVTVLAYQPAWHGAPLWDDEGHLTPPGLQGGDGLRRIWTEPGATQQYYPLVHTAFWVMHRVAGDSTTGDHLLSIGLHACSAWLFALALARLGVPWPWLAALVFALHPVHVESVAWISELKNTLSGVWFLAALVAYLRFDRTRLASAWAVAALCFALALLSKTVTATLPVLLLVLIWWQRGRVDLRRDILPLAPLAIAGAAFGALTAWVEHTFIGARGAGFNLTPVDRLLVAGRAVWFYLGKLAWPSNLTFIYPKWTVSSGVWWQYLYPAALLVLLAGLWRWRYRSRAPLAAMAWFCLALAPALGFVDVYPFRYSYVADHFQYLASLGMIALACGGAATALSRRRDLARTGAGAAILLVVLPLGILTWRQSRDYADPSTLYKATLARDPASWMALNNLAVLRIADRPEEALALTDAALGANPDYPEAHNNRGLALQLLGRFDEAVAAHEAAIRLEPMFADAHNNRGTALQQLGRLTEAADAYREAIRWRKGNLQATVNLGNVLLKSGKPADAVTAYRDALRLAPDQPNVRVALGTALEGIGRRDEAMAEYREALRLEPAAADARARLDMLAADAHLKTGLARYQAGDFQGAANAFAEAVRLAPGSAEAHNDLGAALERLGRRDEAAGQYREAVRLAPGSAEARANLTRTERQGRHER